jgi:hypothetical protein
MTIATPSASVTSAVAVSAANRVTALSIDAALGARRRADPTVLTRRSRRHRTQSCAQRSKSRTSQPSCSNTLRAFCSSLAMNVLIVRAGQEAIRLCASARYIPSIRRFADFCEHADIEGDRVGRHALRQPQRPRLLVLLDRNAGFGAVGMSDQPIVAVTFGPAASRFALNTHSGVTSPPFHWPMLSLGLLVFESM